MKLLPTSCTFILMWGWRRSQLLKTSQRWMPWKIAINYCGIWQLAAGKPFLASSQPCTRKQKPGPGERQELSLWESHRSVLDDFYFVDVFYFVDLTKSRTQILWCGSFLWEQTGDGEPRSSLLLDSVIIGKLLMPVTCKRGLRMPFFLRKL